MLLIETIFHQICIASSELKLLYFNDIPIKKIVIFHIYAKLTESTHDFRHFKPSLLLTGPNSC